MARALASRPGTRCRTRPGKGSQCPGFGARRVVLPCAGVSMYPGSKPEAAHSHIDADHSEKSLRCSASSETASRFGTRSWSKTPNLSVKMA